jgi:hypothetical protein
LDRVQVDSPDASIDAYVDGLAAVLVEKRQAIDDLASKVEVFKQTVAQKRSQMQSMRA